MASWKAVFLTAVFFKIQNLLNGKKIQFCLSWVEK